MEKHEVEKVVEDTVEQVLEKFGLNPDDVHEAQRDFIYLRNQRVSHEKVSFRIRMVIWGMVVTGIVSLTIMGFKDFFK